MQVFKLAKELGKTSSELMKLIKDLGLEIKSVNSNITDEQEEIIRSEFEIKEQPKENKVKTDADYRPDEMISCRSLFPGVLLFTGDHSGMTYTFNGLGDRRNIEYQDLKAGMLQRKGSMFNPDFIIEDKNLINDEHWMDLKTVYDGMYDDEQLKAVYNMPTEKFRQAFPLLPVTAKQAIITLISTAIENKTFENYNKAKIVDDVCGTCFNLKM